MEPQTAQQNIQLSVSIRTDRDHFLRRTCPSCGRDFKTEANPVDLQWALEAYCRRAGVEIGGRDAEDGSSSRIRCPYCQHDEETSRTFTEETVQYLKRILYREYVLPKMNRLFSGLEGSLPRQRASGGMFSISVEFKHNRMMQPVRPIHGPDSSDFKIVVFLCCGKKIKVSEAWNALSICSFCGTEVAVV
jgi:sarcosine oxidase delta subunit